MHLNMVIPVHTKGKIELNFLLINLFFNTIYFLCVDMASEEEWLMTAALPFQNMFWINFPLLHIFLRKGLIWLITYQIN